MKRLVKIRSWHIYAGWDSRGGQHATLCGRFAARDAEQADDYGDEKSCETCLRKAERDA